jgi:hypothetical protein
MPSVHGRMSRKRNYATSSPASRALMLMSNGILLDLLLLIATTRMSMAQIIVTHITAAMYILMTIMLNRTPTLTMLWCWHNQSHHPIRITSTKPLANMRQRLDERTAMFTSCSTTTNTRILTINIITTHNNTNINSISRPHSINRISLNTTAEAHSTIATSFTIITPLITLILITEAIITVTKRITIPMRIQD